MKINILAVSATTLLLASTGAHAAPASAAPARTTAPAAAPVQALASGPAIPGLCVLSTQQAIANSKVGQYVNSRMEQILAQVRAELAPEETSITADAKAFEAARATLDQATLQSRGQALDGRVNALRQKAELRNREIKATNDKSLNRIAQELDPLAQQIYQQRRCSILVDKQAVMTENSEMDLTPSVATALDARIQQFQIDREHLDAAPPAPAR